MIKSATEKIYLLSRLRDCRWCAIAQNVAKSMRYNEIEPFFKTYFEKNFYFQQQPRNEEKIKTEKTYLLCRLGDCRWCTIAQNVDKIVRYNEIEPLFFNKTVKKFFILSKTDDDSIRTCICSIKLFNFQSNPSRFPTAYTYFDTLNTKLSLKFEIESKNIEKIAIF